MKDEQFGMIILMLALFTLVNCVFTNYRILEAEDLIMSVRCTGGK